jgi:predicted ATPase
MPTRAQAPAVPRLTYLRIKNYRALRDVEFRDLTPLTVLIGPNGSGKSTVLDALDFLAEAVRGNLTQAWEKRERFRGMQTRDSGEWTIEFEAEIELDIFKPRLIYKLVIDEADGTVFVDEESLIEAGPNGKRIFFLDDAGPHPLRKGGYENEFRINVYSHDLAKGHSTSPSSTPLIARVGFFPEQMGKDWPSALAIVKFFQKFRRVVFTDKHLKGFSDRGPQERLSADGENLPNVLYYYYSSHPQVLHTIEELLQRRVPSLAEIQMEKISDDRLLMRFSDAPFEKPFPARFMSGGTVKLTALFVLLYEPDAEGLIAIEEPENELHPQLLYRLTEEFNKAAEKRQLFVTTHSPLLLDALDPKQVWVMYRGEDGYAHATCTADMPNVPELVEYGSMLGYLWTSNTFTAGDPQAPLKPNPNAR